MENKNKTTTPAYQSTLWRFFEVVLGVLTWLVVLSPVWLGLIYPQAMVYFLTLLTLYWSYLAIMNTVGLMVGYPKYKKEISIDWYEECKKLNFAELPERPTLPTTLEDVKHFILIPCVSEHYKILEDAFNSFLEQSTVVFIGNGFSESVEQLQELPPEEVDSLIRTEAEEFLERIKKLPPEKVLVKTA